MQLLAIKTNTKPYKVLSGGVLRRGGERVREWICIKSLLVTLMLMIGIITLPHTSRGPLKPCSMAPWNCDFPDHQILLKMIVLWSEVGLSFSAFKMALKIILSQMEAGAEINGQAPG